MLNEHPITRNISSNTNNNHNEDGNQMTGNVVIGDNNIFNQAPSHPADPYQKQLPLLDQKVVGEAFQQNIDEVVKWLKDPMSLKIGVWGMGGVGKTTLLKGIFNKLKEDPEIAGNPYWVVVSQNCNELQLQAKLAKLFGVVLSDMESFDINARLLYNKLSSMGRLVFVLDDVWESFELEEVGLPLSKNSCKVLFSTRDENVCWGMLCGDFVLRVETLSNEDALKLFCKTLENYEELTGEMQNIATSVADKCHSLPLAVVAIARSMRGVKDIDEWQNALNELTDLERGHDTMEKEVLHILRFSHQRLKEEVQKKCFLSCAFHLEFQVEHRTWDSVCEAVEGHKMERKKAIYLWITEGLLDFIKDRSAQLSKAHAIMNQLERACLMEPSIEYGERWVGMHDLMREMAIGISKKDALFLVKFGVELEKFPGEDLWYKDLVKVLLTQSKIKEIPHDMSPKTPNLIEKTT